MSVVVYWDEGDTDIIRMDLAGAWHWEDAYRAVEICEQLVTDRPAPLCGLIDMSGVTSMPPDFTRHVPAIDARLQRLMLITCLVGANRFVHLLVDMYLRVWGRQRQGPHIIWADTVDQGRYQLQIERERYRATRN